MYSPTGAELKLHTSSSLDVTDMMGNTQTHAPVDGVVRVLLDKNPVYVKGTLHAPYIEEIIPVPSSPITLYHSFYENGGYTEVNGPLGTATNKWVTSSVLKGYNGKGSRAITIPTGASATWKPTISTPGRYKVSVYLPGNPAAPYNTTRSANYSIYIDGVKAETKVIDQWTHQGTWMDVGIYDFPRSLNNYVVVEDGSAAHDKPLRADVAKFELIPLTGIALDTDSLDLRVGDTHTLTASVTPAEATDQTLVWSSSNNQIASVDGQGHVIAGMAGTAVIRATHPLTSLYAEAEVRVSEIPIIQKITIYNSYGVNGGYTEVNGSLGTATNKWVTSSVLKGYNGGISRAVTHPTDATAKWTPSISQAGPYRISVYLPGDPASPAYTTRDAKYSIYVDGLKVDTITIDQWLLQGTWQELGSYPLPQGANSYVLLEDGNPAHDRPLRADAVKFEFVPPTGINLDSQALDLRVGETYWFTAGVAPSDATERTLIWSSTNSEVATIDAQGQLHALATGSTVIRATNPLTSLYAEVEVIVRAIPVSQVIIDRTEVTLHPGGTAALSAQILPDNAANPSVTWSTYNSQIAVIDQNGVGTAIAPGQTKIRASSVIADVYAESLVTVTLENIAVSSVTLNKNELEMLIGARETVIAQVYPAYATDQRILWSSNSEAVASVDQQGHIIALSEGIAYIKAQSVADSVYSAEVKVTVRIPPIVIPPTEEVDNSVPSGNEGNQQGTGESKLPNSVLSAKIIGDSIQLHAEADPRTGSVHASISKELIQMAQKLAASSNQAVSDWKFDITPVAGAASYRIEIPHEFITTEAYKHNIHIQTEFGKLILPSHMVQASRVQGYQNLEVLIQPVSPSMLGADIRSTLAGRPVIDIRLLGDGQTELSWMNPAAPVKVSIPYSLKPTEDREKLSVWYIDELHNPTYMTNARYNPQEKAIQFTTSHFSTYAVVLTDKSFADLNDYDWARKPVEVMASKGIIHGTTEQTFAPSENITRADFVVLLTRALGLPSSLENQFTDVYPSDYFHEAVGTAYKLGIIEGTGDGRFEPSELITRQDMITMASKALEITRASKPSLQSHQLESYYDFEDVADYAKSGMELMLGFDLIEGSGNKLNPQAFTTRAEAAVFMYRLYWHQG
ncbi:Endo-1,4-beta-xylanase A precursor [compost metagenome]